MAPAAQALANYFAGAIEAGCKAHTARQAAARRHRRAVRRRSVLQLFAPLRDRNHALHQHPREPVSAPSRMPARHRNQLCQSQAPHLVGCGVRYACTIRIVLCAAAAPRRPMPYRAQRLLLGAAVGAKPTRWHNGNHALHQHACGTCYCPVTHGCPTLNQLCQSQGVHLCRLWSFHCVYTW